MTSSSVTLPCKMTRAWWWKVEAILFPLSFSPLRAYRIVWGWWKGIALPVRIDPLMKVLIDLVGRDIYSSSAGLCTLSLSSSIHVVFFSPLYIYGRWNKNNTVRTTYKHFYFIYGLPPLCTDTLGEHFWTRLFCLLSPWSFAKPCGTYLEDSLCFGYQIWVARCYSLYTWDIHMDAHLNSKS